MRLDLLRIENLFVCEVVVGLQAVFVVLLRLHEHLRLLGVVDQILQSLGCLRGGVCSVPDHPVLSH